MNPDQRPPDAPRNRLPEPLRILDALAAIALHHADRALDGIRYRHAEQSIPTDELDYHQEEHCLCGPTIEALPMAVGGARWLVTHWRALQDADLEHED
ncbi:hypothetical protein [Glycomyces sp. NPDC021274]|uniref:hypothetical protein n=1 Tax=Glycomyces sp. NPDC021274 TaxID=3155120 RepID=UPI0033C2C0AB